MATLRIDNNKTFVTEVTVTESDKYSCDVYLKFGRHYVPENVRGVSEMFLTPIQLENLGHFLIRQAKEIRTEQEMRGK